MIITRKQFEEELEKARNAVLRDVDYDRRFQELSNRCCDLERSMYELRCKIEKLQDGESQKRTVQNDETTKCNM